jgi:sigma-B regulation protein RsbU (phosphoserine phosphatase)
MLRELVERAVLEDMVSGLSRASGLRVAVFDSRGRLITASPPTSGFALLSPSLPERLSLPLDLTLVSTDEPPARVAFWEHARVWYVVAPVHAADQLSGFVAVGELRDPASRPTVEASAHAGAEGLAGLVHTAAEAARLERAWEALPRLRRSGDAQPVVTARWAARLLSSWCRHEVQLDAAADELALLSDISALLSGEQNLQRMLDRIVRETARVMKCSRCSLRLYDERSDELTIAAVHNLSPEYLSKGPVLRAENPIDQEALLGEVVYIDDMGRDPRVRFPEQARREGIVSGLTAGLTFHGQPVGVLRVYSDHRRRFRASERHLLRAVASQSAIAIVNARMAEQRLRTAHVEHQLAMAGTLHARLVRSPPPPFPALDVALVFEPTGHIGGDFSDFLLLPDGRFLAVVGDVVGHHVHAAMLTAYVRGALRATATATSDLGAILTRLNWHIARETDPSEFVSLVLTAFKPDGTRLAYASAGHEPALMLRHGDVLRLEEAGLVLGVEPDEVYTECSVSSQPDDFFLLYSDGAVEAMDFGGALFGRERLAAGLRQFGRLPAAMALRNLRWDIRRFVGLADQSDDVTLVGLRVLPVGQAPAPVRGDGAAATISSRD